MDSIVHFVGQITFGEFVTACLGATLGREICIALLPDRVAGPGGWLIDTSDEG